MTLYETLKAIAKYDKYFIKQNKQNLLVVKVNFQDMEDAIKYQDTPQERLLEELAEKSVKLINVEYGYIELID